MLDNKINKQRICTKFLNNKQNIINLLDKLEFILDPITGRSMDVETL